MTTRTLGSCLGVALVVALCQPAEAAVSFDWVQIGAPGNAGDTNPAVCRGGGQDGDQPCGGVADQFAIGKYEVTNTQYAEFLNAVAADDPNALYSEKMGTSTELYDGAGIYAPAGITRSGSAGSYTYSAVSGRENRPVVWVSWYDGVRFVNWVADGTTETGTYTLTDAPVTRAPGARVFLPTEDEWYKAAFFDPALGIYYNYPAGTSTPTACDVPTANPNSANCYPAVLDTTDVGSYLGSPSPFGTFDQGGNVFEWNETDGFPTDLPGLHRGLHSGSFINYEFQFEKSQVNYINATEEFGDQGFRIAGVPEPATGLLMMAGVLGLAGWRRRRS